MEWATNLISEISKYFTHRDDSGIDRLNRLYTVALLSAFVTLISTQQYVVGGRIACWTPQEFSDAHNTYAHDICWLGQTNYYVSENFTILDSPSSPRAYPFLIYPWLPVILIGMTVCFAAPYVLIWHGLSTRSGIDIKRLMKLTDRDELIRAIHFTLFQNYSIKTHGRFYVISIYLLMKLVYIINLFCQIILINKLIMGDYFKMNIEHVSKILSVNYNMWSSAHVPIETMCDFMVRMLGQNNNWYTTQCILPFNLFTKRIFALLTLWFIILLVLNLIELVFIWLWKRLWLSSRRFDYIYSLLNLYETHLHKKTDNRRLVLAIHNRLLCHDFVSKYLGIDGYILLKFLHASSSNMHMSYLVVQLLDRFSEARRQQPERIMKRHDDIVL